MMFLTIRAYHKCKCLSQIIKIWDETRNTRAQYGLSQDAVVSIQVSCSANGVRQSLNIHEDGIG
jgi:hypothetical protein